MNNKSIPNQIGTLYWKRLTVTKFEYIMNDILNQVPIKLCLRIPFTYVQPAGQREGIIYDKVRHAIRTRLTKELADHTSILTAAYINNTDFLVFGGKYITLHWDLWIDYEIRLNANYQFLTDLEHWARIKDPNLIPDVTIPAIL
jgi:hypothetical protein